MKKNEQKKIKKTAKTFLKREFILERGESKNLEGYNLLI